MSKPEKNTLPPEIHYKTSKKYAASTRLNYIQKEITKKCLSFLDLQKKSLILDLGCGTGISSREIANNGHFWIGCDISIDMLNELVMTNNENSDTYDTENISTNSEYENSTENSDNENISECSITEKELQGSYKSLHDKTSNNNEENNYNKKVEPYAVINLDIANVLPFKPGTFDGIISVSCLQWIFHGKSLQESRKSVRILFTSVKSVLKIKSIAVFQFYNIHKDHTKILSEEAQKCGFFSNIVFDGAGRNKKSYLVLDYKSNDKKKDRKRVDKVREEIERRKERRIKKGLPVSRDSKYTGRRRCKKF